MSVNKILVLFLLFMTAAVHAAWYLPANYTQTTDIASIKLTAIGTFGLLRKARPSVPEHYHTGIDIVRPNSNYANEPVFPAKEGEIVSILDNGPFSQVIIKHTFDTKVYWSVYEHLHVVVKNTGTTVTPHDTIGYFFNKPELAKYGRQFDHVHFEILKVHPIAVKRAAQSPERLYKTYALHCFTKAQLNSRLENPISFLKDKIVARK